MAYETIEVRIEADKVGVITLNRQTTECPERPAHE